MGASLVLQCDALLARPLTHKHMPVLVPVPQYRATLEAHLRDSPDSWTRDCVRQPEGGAAQQGPRFKGLGSRCDGCGEYALETRACAACRRVVYCRCGLYCSGR